MLSLQRWGIFSLVLIVLKGVGCEDLSPVNNEKFSLEDNTVTLFYKYSKTITASDDFYWYRQYPGKPPESLLYISGLNISKSSDSLKSDKRFSTKLSGEKHLDLQISCAAVSDSALYYCAVRPGTGTKLIFGSGTRLTIETTDEQPPFYYKVGDDETKICLATGFTRLNATKDQMLNKSLPVRISGDSVFNQVSFLSASDTCGGEETPECSNDWEPDSKVNMTFVIVMGLRLIFLKTIVFNVLMTLRMWLSQ